MKKIKQFRSDFDKKCRERDKNRCVMCGRTTAVVKLSVHHITDRHLMPNDGYVESNGITLCDDQNGRDMSCHLKAEQYHIHDGKTFISSGYHPLELYEKIGSSPEKAWKDSAALTDDNVPEELVIIDRNLQKITYLRGEKITKEQS